MASLKHLDLFPDIKEPQQSELINELYLLNNDCNKLIIGCDNVNVEIKIGTEVTKEITDDTLIEENTLIVDEDNDSDNIIDVNFNNGWKVLETIRKYLTSPQIITLLSGDIKLFSKSIRKPCERAA